MKINRVFANQDSFRAVTLQPGMNIVLADRTKESTRTHSRNGLGKSTLIEIVHFVLGSNLGKEQNLHGLRGTSWEFSLDLTISGVSFTATRAMDKTSEIHISGDTRTLGLHTDHKSGGSIRLNLWRAFLGRMNFSLDERDLEDESYKPSFRSLISYFSRSGRGAYLNCFETRSKQLKWHTQVYNSFLLGLNWKPASEWQELRDREKLLKAVGRQASESLERLVGRVGELESEKIRLQARVNDLAEQAASFRVVEEYREVEEHVNAITFEMQDLAKKRTFENRLILRYEGQLEDETPPSGLSVVELFRQVEVSLPASAVRRLDEVNEFHNKVTQNRQEYLRAEITRLRLSVAERDERIAQLETERKDALSLLETGGALEDFTRLQMRLVEARAELESIDRRIEEAQKLRAGQKQVTLDRQELEQRAIIDHEERRSIWSRAVEYFARNTEYLYGEPSDLIINITDNGYEFRTRMEAAGSHGRDNMAILCYDLAISRLWSDRPRQPGFLIHDSEMFDPVDERQYARGLQLAAEQSLARGHQYLAVLNSDTLPMQDLQQLEFDVNQYVRLTLTDSDPRGSLLGIRF
jgi:uncharacterized protein YydD (DUF2326 family)